MNLLPSILATLVITALIWLLLLLQPQARSTTQAALQAPFTHAPFTRQQRSETASAPTSVQTPASVHATVHERSQAEPGKQARAVVNAVVADQPVQSQAIVKRPASISGMTQIVELEHIDQLWAGFIPLLERVRRNPQAIFVYYRQFDRTYTQAKVSIGIDSRVVNVDAEKPVLSALSLPDSSRYQLLLGRAVRTNTELADGWNSINYNRGVESVLEVHFLDADYNPGESQLFVEYR